VLALAWLTFTCGSLYSQAERDRQTNLMPRPRLILPDSGFLTVPNHLLVQWSEVPETWRPDLSKRLDLVASQAGLSWGLATDLSGNEPLLAFRFSETGTQSNLRREGYELTVDATGVNITADSPEGFFYGLVTLQQLLPAQPEWNRPVLLALGTLVDWPVLSWRGLMVDSSRHFLSVGAIKAILELMARHKLNRFHWHLTDDQGWRLEVPGWPALTTKGAWRTEVNGTVSGGFYTAPNVREVVNYARERQIVIIPEVDVPGHSSAALAAYPTLSGNGKPREVPLNWNVADGVLSLGRPEVKQFTSDVLSTLVDLFPGPYIHWGGDEVFRTPWMTNAQSLAWMRSVKANTAEAALAAFWNDLASQTLARGKIPIGWDEVVMGKPPSGTVIQWWDAPERGLAAFKGGYNVVSSWKWNSYFDYPEVGWDNDRVSWMPLVPLEAVASNPFYPPGATQAQKNRLLGLEATLFSERVTEGRWPRKLFPRLAVFAELAWRPVRGGVPGWESRLAFHRQRLESWGVGMFQIGQ